jgi:hypothetical protein
MRRRSSDKRLCGFSLGALRSKGLVLWNQKTLTAKCAKKGRKAREEIQIQPPPTANQLAFEPKTFVTLAGFQPRRF